MCHSLKRNVAWTLAGNCVYAACQWGMLAALTKLATPRATGEFAIGLAVTAPVFLLLNLQLRAVQSTDSRNLHSFYDYQRTRIITTSVALAVIAAFSFVARDGGASAAILLVGAAKAVESFSDIRYGLLQRHERMTSIAVSLMLRGLASLVAFSAAVFATRSAAWGAAAMALAGAVVFAAYDLPVTRPLQAQAPRSGPNLAKLVFAALPLGIVMMLISLNTNVPRYFIDRLHGTTELGIYAALAYIPIAGHVVVDAVGQTLAPRLAVCFSSGRRDAAIQLLARGSAIACAAGAALVLIGAVAGDRLVELLYRPEYAGRPLLLVLLMIAGAIGFVGSMLGYGLTAAGAFRVQAPIYATGVLVNIAACWALIPVSGLTGAAWALIGSNSVLLLLSAVALMRASAAGVEEAVPANA